MPCTSDDDRDQIYDQLQEVTDLLCRMCRQFEGKLPEKVAPWWARHKKIDSEKERRKREVAARLKRRDAAMRKLTPEDREALGLGGL